MDDVEIKAGTDPDDPDSDDDGLLDGEEVGPGAFSAVPLDSLGTCRWVATADVDGDGDVDVLSNDYPSGFVWYENTDGKGGFSSPLLIVTRPYLGGIIVPADLDGDSDADVLTETVHDETLRWHESDGGFSGVGTSRVIATGYIRSLVNSLVASDLDSDGDTDVLLGGYGKIVLSWHENLDGSGSFGPQIFISSQAEYIRAAAAADLDGDGDTDVLAVSRGLVTETLGWHENIDGAGGFGARRLISSEPIGSSTRRILLAADVDRDGDTDVVSVSPDLLALSWHENSDGAGTFGMSRPIGTTGQRNRSAAVVDLDGDGDLDVIASSLDRFEVSWFENTDGFGSFGSKQIIASAADPASLSSMSPADLDGDGDIDILVGAAGGPWWYENLDLSDPLDPDSDDDDLTDFEEVQVHGTSPLDPDSDGDRLGDYEELRLYGSDPLDTDTDGDHLEDGDEVQLYLTDPASNDTDRDGLEDGFELAYGFDPLEAGEETMDPDADGLTNLDEQAHGADPLNPDTDGDGLTDGDEVHVYATQPGAADTDQDRLLDAFEIAFGLDPVDPDENENGLLDAYDDPDSDGLANEVEQRAGTNPVDVDTDDDRLEDGEELGSGSFGDARVISDGDYSPASAITADVDGDGDWDVVSAGFGGRRVSWHENTDGAGSFGPEQVIATRLGPVISIYASDIDGDGDTDLLSASNEYNGLIAWFENMDGLGSFGLPIPISGAYYAWSVAAADVDGDGDADVLIASGPSGFVWWHENITGLGDFGPPQVVSATADGVRSVVGVDLDGDGDTDVLTGSEGRDSPAWYENLDGAGHFGPRRTISSTGNYSARYAFAADIDRDGDPDVVSGAWFRNTNGEGDFVIAHSYPFFAQRSAVPSDIDGDGDLDVLSIPFTGGALRWNENVNGAGSFGPWQDVSADVYDLWSVVSEDLDGDGDMDVLAASKLGRSVAWYENLNFANPLDPDTDGDGLLDAVDPCPRVASRYCLPELSAFSTQVAAVASVIWLGRRRKRRSATEARLLHVSSFSSNSAAAERALSR